MSTPTPRTDAALLSSDCAFNCGHSFNLLIEEKYDEGKCVRTGLDIAHGNDGVVVLADFARQLETELTAERARLDWVFRNCKITADGYPIHDREDLGVAIKEGAK